MDFTDRVVLVTGASGNLGRAVAQAYARAGASLVLVGRDLDHLRRAFGDLGNGPAPVLVAADLTQEDATRRMAHEALERCGRIDVLAHLAGGFRGGTPVHDTPQETWDLLLDLNLRTVVNAARAVVPHMLEHGRGVLVYVAARAGLEGTAGLGAYSATKSAAIRLVESMAAELKDKGVRVNCVLPGVVDSPANRAADRGADTRGWVTPEALADLIVFLSSDAARAVSGAAIPT